MMGRLHSIALAAVAGLGLACAQVAQPEVYQITEVRACTNERITARPVGADQAALDACLSQVNSQPINFGYRDNAIFRLRVVPVVASGSGGAAGASPVSFALLEIRYPSLDRVTLYESATGVSGQAARRLWTIGDGVPFARRPVPHNNLIFPVRPGVLYDLHVQTSGQMYLPLAAYSSGELAARDRYMLLLSGLYYGVMALLAGYGVFLALTLRDSGYLYFAAAVIFSALYFGTINGMAYEYMWPGVPELNGRMLLVSLGLAPAFTMLFIRWFLLYKEGPRPRDWFAIVFFALCAAIVVLGAAGVYRPILSLGNLMLVYGCVYMFVLSVRYARRGRQAAYFFLAGLLLVGAGVLATVLRSLQIIPPYFFSRPEAMQLISMGQLVLCSFALVERMRDLEREREAARADSRVKSRVLANVSHEIRTPLNAIVGTTELLGETQLGELQKAYVGVLDRSGRMLLSLVDDLLDVSRLETDDVLLEEGVVDLRAMFVEVDQTYGAAARQKGLGFRAGLESHESPLIIGDRRRLRQILANLVANGVKFTQQGEVTVLARLAKGDNPGRLMLICEVRDTGIGIPVASVPRIFDALTQADESITRQFGGAGLGLAIATRLVRRMGGQIRVESQEGRGSCFKFEIPCRVATPAEIAANLPPATAANEEPEALSILIVEDNPDNVALLFAYFKDTPHRLDHAANGQRAVELFEARDYNVILMDIQMPVMDGLTATRAIRAREQADMAAGSRRRRARIYALTAHALPGEDARSYEAGCDLHLNKPIRKQELLAVVRQGNRQPGDTG